MAKAPHDPFHITISHGQRPKSSIGSKQIKQRLDKILGYLEQDHTPDEAGKLKEELRRERQSLKEERERLAKEAENLRQILEEHKRSLNQTTSLQKDKKSLRNRSGDMADRNDSRLRQEELDRIRREERDKLLMEAELKRIRDEEREKLRDEEMKRQQELEAGRRQQEMDERKRHEEMEAKRNADLEARRRQEELDEKRRQEELDQRRKQEDLDAKRRQEELEARKRQEELEARKRQEELEARRRQEELEQQDYEKMIKHSQQMRKLNVDLKDVKDRFPYVYEDILPLMDEGDYTKAALIVHAKDKLNGQQFSVDQNVIKDLLEKEFGLDENTAYKIFPKLDQLTTNKSDIKNKSSEGLRQDLIAKAMQNVNIKDIPVEMIDHLLQNSPETVSSLCSHLPLSYLKDCIRALNDEIRDKNIKPGSIDNQYLRKNISDKSKSSIVPLAKLTPKDLLDLVKMNKIDSNPRLSSSIELLNDEEIDSESLKKLKSKPLSHISPHIKTDDGSIGDLISQIANDKISCEELKASDPKLFADLKLTPGQKFISPKKMSLAQLEKCDLLPYKSAYALKALDDHVTLSPKILNKEVGLDDLDPSLRATPSSPSVKELSQMLKESAPFMDVRNLQKRDPVLYHSLSKHIDPSSQTLTKNVGHIPLKFLQELDDSNHLKAPKEFKTAIDALIEQDFEREDSGPKEIKLKSLPSDFSATNDYGQKIAPSVGDLNDDFKFKSIGTQNISNEALKRKVQSQAPSIHSGVIPVNELTPSTILE